MRPPGQANSSRSAKGIGLLMHTHCQTAVLLPNMYVALMRGEKAIPGLVQYGAK